MKALRIRQQQTVTDPLQSERLLKALTIIPAVGRPSSIRHRSPPSPGRPCAW